MPAEFSWSAKAIGRSRSSTSNEGDPSEASSRPETARTRWPPPATAPSATCRCTAMPVSGRRVPTVERSTSSISSGRGGWQRNSFHSRHARTSRCWGPDGLLYVSTELDESISVFDPEDDATRQTAGHGRRAIAHVRVLTGRANDRGRECRPRVRERHRPRHRRSSRNRRGHRNHQPHQLRHSQQAGLHRRPGEPAHRSRRHRKHFALTGGSSFPERRSGLPSRSTAAVSSWRSARRARSGSSISPRASSSQPSMCRRIRRRSWCTPTEGMRTPRATTAMWSSRSTSWNRPSAG